MTILFKLTRYEEFCRWKKNRSSKKFASVDDALLVSVPSEPDGCPIFFPPVCEDISESSDVIIVNDESHLSPPIDLSPPIELVKVPPCVESSVSSNNNSCDNNQSHQSHNQNYNHHNYHTPTEHYHSGSNGSSSHHDSGSSHHDSGSSNHDSGSSYSETSNY